MKEVRPFKPDKTVVASPGLFPGCAKGLIVTLPPVADVTVNTSCEPTTPEGLWSPKLPLFANPKESPIGAKSYVTDCPVERVAAVCVGAAEVPGSIRTTEALAMDTSPELIII